MKNSIISIVTSWRLISHLERRKIAGLTIFRSLLNVLDLLGLAGVGLLVSYGLSQIGHTEGSEFLGIKISLVANEALILAGIVGAVFISKSALSAVALNSLTSRIATIEAKFSKDIVAGIFSPRFLSQARMNLGEINWAAGQSSLQAFGGLLLAGSVLVSESILFLLVIGGLLFLDPLGALGMLIFFGAVVVLFQKVLGKELKTLGKRISESNVKAQERIRAIYESFREISVLEMIDVFVGRYHSARAEESRLRFLQRYLQGLPRFILEASLFLGLVLFLGLQLAFNELEIALVNSAVMLTGSMRLMASLLPIQNVLVEIRAISPQAREAQNLAIGAKQDGGVQSIIAANQIKSSSGFSVQLADVAFRFQGAGTDVFAGFSTTISPGQRVGIIGPSGSGKSTLLELIGGLLLPTRGLVEVESMPPGEIRLAAPQSVAYVPQRVSLFEATVAENIAVGISPAKIDRERLDEVVRLAGLEEFISSLPGKFEAFVGPSSHGLSGGQTQRIGLARALYFKPHLLLLDEVTSALDGVSEEQLVRTLQGLDRCVTVIAVFHRQKMAEAMDRIIDLGTVTSPPGIPA